MANNNGNDYEAHRRRVMRNRRRKNGSTAATGESSRGSISPWIKVVAALGLIGLVAFFGLAVAVIIVYRSYANDLVAPDELAINKPSYGARILDRNGALLYEYVDDKSGLRRPVKLQDVAPAFLAATIATEDDSFFTNPGVNIQGLIRAAWENSPLGNVGGSFGEGSGGSSITQQLVKNVYIPAADRQKRSPLRKIKETVYALELTQRYEKERILEWYVNQISYGGVYNGVEAAAQGYFGVSAKDLTLAEAATLAGIPQSPAAYDPVNHPEASAARREQILDIMERKTDIRIGKDKHYVVNRDEVEAARQTPIEIAVKRFPIEAPHFVLQYIQPQLEEMFSKDALYRDGLVVTTTLDLDLQHKTQDNMEKWISQFEDTSQSRNGAMMVMDPTTGEILTMVGSRDYFRDDIEGKNNNATACNSPGSSFKPFAYLAAFQDLGWGPGTMILDTPVTYTDGRGNEFSPSNPEHDYAGPVTIRYALGNSLNVPATKAAAAEGPSNVVALARKMGFMNTFRTTDDGGCSAGGGYGPAIATGGVDVTLEEMMIGYSALATGGVMNGQTPIDTTPRRANERKIDPISILKVTDNQGRTRFDVNEKRKSERVAREDDVYLVTNVLTDGSAECATFGCSGIQIPGRQAGVKTGTSEPYDPKGPNAGKIGETWAFGYTPNLVVGIWAGNTKNQPIINIFSTSISYRAMRDTMQDYYNGKASPAFTRPGNVVSAELCVPSGLKPTPLCGKTTSDLFVKDALPTKDDDWWQKVKIDVRNNKLAAPTTPPQYVQEQTMLVFPPDLLKSDDDRKRAQDWADSLKLPLAPTDVSDLAPNVLGPTVPGAPGAPSGLTSSDPPALIYSPSVGQNVSGVVIVNGRAYSPAFDNYKLEYGSGTSPTTWNLINQQSIPSAGGPLGAWNATNLTPGDYTLRLTVQDRQRGPITATVTVTVGP